MKALFVAITLLTAVTASAQTAPTLAPPPGQSTGSAPPAGSNGFRGDDNNEFRRGRRGTMVVVEREVLEQRLANLENLLGEAFERSGRGQGRGKLREAHDALNDLRELLADAPDVRDYNPRPSPPQPAPPPAPMYQPIADGKLQKIMNAMGREPFAEDKMNILEDVVSNENYFVVGQVQQVLSQFQFSKDRLQAVRLLWSRVLDRQNGFQLYNSFQFSSEKAELKKILNNG